jgi:hypothetical protein
MSARELKPSDTALRRYKRTWLLGCFSRWAYRNMESKNRLHNYLSGLSSDRGDCEVIRETYQVRVDPTAQSLIITLMLQASFRADYQLKKIPVTYVPGGGNAGSLSMFKVTCRDDQGIQHEFSSEKYVDATGAVLKDTPLRRVRKG